MSDQKTTTAPNRTVTLRQLYDEYSALFLQKGIETARLDVRLLLSHAYNLSHEDFIAERDTPIDPDQSKELMRRRLAGEPVAKILGRKEFWSMDFHVTGDVLDPRPDSETLIQAVLDNVADRQAPLSVLDLGTGSGCLITTLLKELPNAAGYAVDISPAALEVARRNLQENGVLQRCILMQGSWEQALHVNQRFDIIVSNPPYIPTEEVYRLSTEVKDFEPFLALDGGEDGLESYRQIIDLLPRIRHEESKIFFECGAGQAEALEALIMAGGADKTLFYKDLSGISRVVASLFGA